MSGPLVYDTGSQSGSLPALNRDVRNVITRLEAHLRLLPEMRGQGTETALRTVTRFTLLLRHAASKSERARSRSYVFSPGKNWTRRLTSPSRRDSPRATEPNSASRSTPSARISGSDPTSRLIACSRVSGASVIRSSLLNDSYNRTVIPPFSESSSAPARPSAQPRAASRQPEPTPQAERAVSARSIPARTVDRSAALRRG